MTKDMTSGAPMKLILGFSVPLLFGFLFQQFYNLVDTLIVGRYLGVDALAAVGTSGAPMKLILGFSVPLLFGFLFQQFYNLVDTLIVGRYLGVDALAAVGSTGSLNFLIIGFCMGVCNGFAIPLAHKFGAGDYSGMRAFMMNAVYLSVVFSVVMTVFTVAFCRPILELMQTPENIIDEAYAYIVIIFIGIPATYLYNLISMTVFTVAFCRPILELMQTPENIIDEAYAYIVIIFIGIPATYLYNLISGVIRSMGDSRTPVVFRVMASVINILLDIVLIVWVDMGVAGAAVATVVSQLLSGLGCLFYSLRKFELLHTDQEERRLRPSYIKTLCGMGVPMGLQYSITAIGSVVLQSAVNTLGSDAVAAMTAGSKISMFFCCPFDALGSTMATYGGQNMGAGKLSRIGAGLKASTVLGVIYAAAAFLTLFFAGEYLALFFVEKASPQAGKLSRIGAGLKASTVLGVIYAAAAFLTLFFAGEYLALFFVEKASPQIIANVHLLLIINSAFYVPLLFVNTVRFLIQGMGYSKFAIFAGLLLIINSAFYVPLLFVNTVRFLIQGMGYSKFAIFAGVFEMAARTLVGFAFVPVFGFAAACFASPVAWVFADIFLFPAYVYVYRRSERLLQAA